MAVSQPGSAAGGALDAPRRPVPAIPQPSSADDLLEAVRRGLAPADPVARLLAGLVPPPARPVCSTRVRPAIVAPLPAGEIAAPAVGTATG